MPPMPPATKTLLLVCVAMFCLDQLVPLVRLFALFPLGSSLFMPWQVLTYAFLHGDAFHLFFNMLGLWMFGSELERLWGARRYLMFLLVGVLAAATAQLLVSVLMGLRGPTVGASGGIYALLLAYALAFPNRTVMLLLPPIPMKARTLVIILVLIDLFFGFKGSSGVAHFAHLGGMVGGFLMIRYWRGQPPFGRR